jgi:1-pyrroline-5-carboxylate dehydrogenase
VPGPAERIVEQLVAHPRCSGIHFTGSTAVLRRIWRLAAQGIERAEAYPRIVGEAGGKNMHFVHQSADVETVVNQTIRAAFEYQGQKCSACSRAYVPDSLWPAVKARLLHEAAQLRVGPVDDLSSFMSAVVSQAAFDKIRGYIERARASRDATVLFGGTCDDSRGYYIAPTIIETSSAHSPLMTEEIFGPVLAVFVYPADQYEHYLDVAAHTSPYALTAGLFARDRRAISTGSARLRYAAGNLYVNDKCTGAVVGHQPFGGSRASGTNDKAGSPMGLLRWVSARTIKESFAGLADWRYPSNLPE